MILVIDGPCALRQPDLLELHDDDAGSSFQAMLVCSVLAEHVGVLSSTNPETAEDRVHTLVNRVLMHECTEDVLAWQDRVPQPQWHDRWERARKAAATFYTHVPGADRIPSLSALADAVVPVPPQPNHD